MVNYRSKVIIVNLPIAGKIYRFQGNLPLESNN